MSGTPFLLMFAMSAAISMALTALMARHAATLGMIDWPDSRKVHTEPVPRVGGVGIVVGAVVPIVLWIPHDRQMLAYLLAAGVLLIFGVWDDRKELGHYVKFVGQFAAAGLLVYYGGLYVSHFPLLGLTPLAPDIGKPFTVFAIVGMINAVNHSDGLDGLAGGLSLLSLGCIAYFASLGGGGAVIVVIAVTAATAGGVFGFLRYNTHPARVFMGDGGSQFLGLTLGYLAVLLTQHADTALSAALPLLFLGLPIADILGVFVQRVYHRMNWFHATKNHLHHRLLMLGLRHYESVVLIYVIQTGFILAAVAMRYQSDTAIIVAYLGTCTLIYGGVTYLERTGWRPHRISGDRSARPDWAVKLRWLLGAAAERIMGVLVPSGLVVASLLPGHVTPGIGSVATALLVLLVLSWTVLRAGVPMSIRLIVYVDAATISYLTEVARSPALVSWEPFEYAYFALLLLSLIFVIRFVQRNEFEVTPTDYLTITAVGVSAVFPVAGAAGVPVTGMLVKAVILFYACEYLLNGHVRGRRALVLATVTSLAILAVRGVGAAKWVG